MKRYRIACIVEGHGEQHSLPLLVQRWLAWRGFRNFEALEPAVRTKASGAFLAAHQPDRQIGIEYYVEVALRKQPHAILIIRDADDDCIQNPPGNPGLGPRLLGRAQAVSNGVPVGVVIANREFEAWILASLSRVRQAGLIPGARFQESHPPDTVGFHPVQPERYRDCKKPLTDTLTRSYSSSVDQKRLVQHICFTPAACRRSPSLGKFLRELDRLTRLARRTQFPY